MKYKRKILNSKKNIRMIERNQGNKMVLIKLENFISK